MFVFQHIPTNNLLSEQTSGVISKLQKSVEEVVALVVNEQEGREVLHLDLPDGLHAQLGVLQTLHLLDVLLRQHRRRTADAAQVEASVLLAGVRHLLAAVSLRQRDHAAAELHERVQIRVHATSRRGSEGTYASPPARFLTRSHALGRLRGSGVVDDVVLHVLRHGLAAIDALLDLGVGDVAADDDGAGQREARLDGVLVDDGQNVLHRLVQIDLHRVVRLVLRELLEEAAGVVLQLLHEQTLLRDLRPALRSITKRKPT